MRLLLAACASTIWLSGCSTHYLPLKIDDKTGFYPTSVQVDPGGVTVYDTSVDAKTFKYVLLLADSNIRPSVFNFTVRQTLAQVGILKVYSPDEFLFIAREKGLIKDGAQLNTELVQRFAKEIGSVMVVNYTYQYVGDARFYSRLSVTDAVYGKTLLRVDHPRLNMMNADTETLYPVLNQLRKWVSDSNKGRT